MTNPDRSGFVSESGFVSLGSIWTKMSPKRAQNEPRRTQNTSINLMHRQDNTRRSAPPYPARGRHYGFWQNRWDGEGLRFRRPQKMAELQIPKPRSFSILAKVNFVCCSVLSSAGAQIPSFDLHAWPSRLGEQHQSCSRLINPSLQST